MTSASNCPWRVSAADRLLSDVAKITRILHRLFGQRLQVALPWNPLLNGEACCTVIWPKCYPESAAAAAQGRSLSRPGTNAAGMHVYSNNRVSRLVLRSALGGGDETDPGSSTFDSRRQ